MKLNRLDMHHFEFTSHYFHVRTLQIYLQIYVTQYNLLLDYWATQNQLLHSQEHIDWLTNSEDWQDEVNFIFF